MKTNVFMLTSMMAGGAARAEGRIYALEEKVAAAVFAGHNGREPTPAELERLGIEKDPAPAAPAVVLTEKERAALAKKRAKAGESKSESKKARE